MRARWLIPGLCLALAACSGAVGDGSGDGTGDDTGAPPAEDTGVAGDDTATRNETSGGGKDTGSTAKDSGTAPVDTGTPPPVDTGTVAPDTSSGDPLDAARQICVDEINKYRATLSLPPLTRDAKDEICGDGEAKKDSISGVAHSAFPSCGESAQNECPGWPGPPETLIKGCLKMMWAEGPGADFSTHGHYINMSSKSYTQVSCGFFKMTSGSYWAVQDFR